MALVLNAATKKALKASASPKVTLRDILLSSKTAMELAEIVADYYFEKDAAVAPKVKISKEQFEQFFAVEGDKPKSNRGRKPKAEKPAE